MDLVSYKEIAQRLGVNPSTVRRLIEQFGPNLKIEVIRRRSQTSNAKAAHHLSREDCDRLIAFYESRNGPTAEMEQSVEVLLQTFGVFYVIQLVPEALPNRIKIGYTDNLTKRLGEHRTAAPTARVIASWPCKRSWDFAAMDSITRDGCTWVLNEVFDGSPEGFINRGNAFFSLMPSREKDRELAEHSPLRTLDSDQGSP